MSNQTHRESTHADLIGASSHRTLSGAGESACSNVPSKTVKSRKKTSGNTNETNRKLEFALAKVARLQEEVDMLKQRLKERTRPRAIPK